VVPDIGSIFLGASVDPNVSQAGEINGQPSVGADGDDGADQDDEDGVVPTAGWTWSQADGGKVDVTVSGDGCLAGWMDWNGDGDFGAAQDGNPNSFIPDDGEEIISNVPVSTGTATYAFPIPVDVTTGTFYARYRLFPREANGNCNRGTQAGSYFFATDKFPTAEPTQYRVETNGEVEDYVWTAPPRGGQGCTPGYWKQRQHFDSWPDGYETTDKYDIVFGVSARPLRTLLQALGLGGGGERALARHATAALLNAANDDVNYAYTVDEVIAMVQAAYESAQYEPTKDLFETENERGCPLN
jgi:hypothetical protein